MHEFLITPWSGALDGLPYDSANSVVRENKLANLEGLEDVLPSATATMRLVLRPGEYVVFQQPAAQRLQIGIGAPVHLVHRKGMRFKWGFLTWQGTGHGTRTDRSH